MTTFTWSSPNNGDWNTPTAWSGDTVPDGSGADVMISVPGSYAVGIAAGESFNVDSLTLATAQATLAVAGLLTLSGTSDSLFLDQGALALGSGGTIATGTIVANGGQLAAQGGTLAGITYQGDLTLTGSGQSLFIANGITLQNATGGGPGSIDLSAASASGISVLGSGTLDHATLSFGAGTGDSLSTGIGNDSGNTLTLGGGFTVDVGAGGADLGYQTGSLTANDAGDALNNAGLIAIDGGTLAVNYGTFTNTGSIAVIGGGGLDVTATAFSNAGTITVATGSSLYMLTDVTTSQLQGITDGGSIQINGTLDNTGQTLTVGPGGSFAQWDLYYGDTILGGTIQDSGSGMVFTGGILDGVTYEGTLNLTPSGSVLEVAGGLTATGTAEAGPGFILLGDNASLTFDDTQTLDDATVALEGSGGSLYQNTTSAYFSASGGQAGTLTLGPNLIVDQVSGSYFLGSQGSGNGAIVNDGTIEAAVGSSSLAIAPAEFTNAGLIDAAAGSGQVVIQGATFLNSGSIIAAAGSGELVIASAAFTNTGTLDVQAGNGLAYFAFQSGTNSGQITIAGTVNFLPALLAQTAAGTITTAAGGSLNLQGTISGGTIIGNGGQMLAQGGTLVGVSYQGTLDLSAANSSLTLTGGTSFSGIGGSGRATIDFNGPAFQSSYLYVLGTATLDNATIDIGNGGAGYNHLVNQDTAGTGAILTLGPNLTLDQVGATAALDGGSYAGDGIVNEGTIIAAVSGSIFYVDATNFTNDGSIIVSNGAFIALEGAPTAALINSITKSGGLVQIGGVVTGGTILAPTGGVGGAGGTLVGVSYQGTLDLSAANSSLTLTGGTSFSGAGGSGQALVNLNGPSFQSSYLYVLGTETLDNAVIDIGNAGAGYNHLVNEDTADTGAILTLGPHLTLNQAGVGAVLNSSDLTGDGIVNEGTIIAGYAGGTFFIDATNFTNDGSMVVSNGGFMALEGVPTATLINSITKSGGLVQIGGVVNGGTILAPTGGVGGAGGTLVGVTYEGTLDLSAANSSLTLTGGTSFSGAGGSGQALINLNGPSFQSSYLYVLGTETLDNAVIDIGNAGAGYNHLVNEDTAGTGATLTLGPRLTLNQAGIGAVLNSSDLAGDGIVNEGTIIAGYAGGTFYMDATNLTNDGTIIVTNGGFIALEGAPTATLINSITKSGGTVRIGGVVNGGTILAPTGGVGGQGGTLVGVTYQGTLDLSAANSSLTLTGGTSFSGAGGSGQALINLNGPSFQSSYLYVLGTGTLDNAVIDIGNVGAGSNHLVAEDTASTGAILTLGSNLALVVEGPGASLASSSNAGDGIVNDGTISAAVAGARLNVDATNFTNDGTIIVANGATIAVEPTGFVNLSAGILTGGVFVADAGGTLILPANATVTTDAADITMSGANSVIETAGGTALDATLTTIAAGGTLRLLNGRGLTTSASLTDSGQLQLGAAIFAAGGLAIGTGGSLFGDGTVLPAVTSDGTIIAEGGRLDLSAAVTGAGALVIDPGATLELGGTTGQAVTFAPAISSGGTLIGGTLKIDTPSSYSGAIAGFALGDTIDLADLAVTSATITPTGTLVAEISGGTTQSFALGGSFTAGALAVTSDGGTGSDIFFAAVAQAALDTPGTIDFGNVRLGNAPSQAVGVTNLSPAGGALLSAGIAGTSGAATGSGAVTLLAPGATDSTDLTVGINAGTAGVETGTVTVGFTSYAGAGSAPIPDGTGMVEVQGTVYRAATAQITTSGPIYLHPGDLASVPLLVRNTDPADGYSESLLASLVGVSGALGGGTGTVDVAAGGSDNAGLTVALTAGAAGSYAGTVLVETETSGQGTDGLGTAVLGTVDVPIGYTVDNYATAALAQIGGAGSLEVTGTPDVFVLNLGSADQSGAALTANLEVLNAAAGPVADLLGGSIVAGGGSEFANTGFGSFSDLGYGAADTSPTISLGTGTIGTFTEQLVLTATGSNASSYAAALAAQTVEVVGTIVASPEVVVSGIAAPAAAQAGEQVPITWILTNQGSATAVGPWTDAVYLASDAAGDNLIPLGTALFSGTIAPSQSVTVQDTVILPGSLAGNEWLVVRTDVGNQLNEPLGAAAKQAVASGPTDILATPTLAVGTPVSGTLAAGQTGFYQIALAAGENVDLTAISNQVTAANAFTVGYGAIATNGQAITMLGTQGVADPLAILTATSAGTYYIALADNSISGGETYSLSATAVPFSISHITPNSGSNLGSVTLTINGAEFNANQQVEVVAPDGTVRDATSVDWVNGSQLWATFNLQGLAVGTYSVEIGNGTLSAALPDAFQVTNGPTGQASVSLVVQAPTLAGGTGTVTVDYANNGQTDVTAPVLDLTATQALLDAGGVVGSSGNIVFLGTNPSGPAGVLQPGVQGSVSFTYIPADPTGTLAPSFSVGTLLPTDSTNGQTAWNGIWSSLESALQPPTVDATDWNNVWTDFVGLVGTTTASVESALSKAATELSQVGQPTDNIATLMQYELFQASGAMAGTYLDAASDIAPTSSPLSLSLSRYYNATLLGRDAAGEFGAGWTSNYDVTATTDASGNVYIQSPGVLHVFTLQADGTYAAAPGDAATLTVANGLYQMNDGSGDVERFLADGKLASVTDPHGNVVNLTYNSAGVLQQVASAATGETITFTSNAQGLITGATDSNGETVSYSYNTAGTQLLSASGAGGITTYTYANPTGTPQDNALTSITNPDGAQTSFTYNSQGWLASQSSSGGTGQLTYTYGPGQVTVTNALGNASTFLYGANGAIAQTQDALGNATQLQYGSTGLLTGLVTPGSSTLGATYDTSGNLTGYTDPLGGTVSATYAPGTDQLTKLTNQAGASIAYSYDAAGDVTGITYQDGSGDAYQYNTTGLLTSKTDANGNTIGYSYNSAGELTRESFSDGTANTYAYDAQGNLISATTQSGATTSYTYNAADQLTSVTDPTGKVESYTYNANGQLATRAEPGGSVVQYSYTPAGQLSELQDGSGHLLDQYVYNTAGQLTETLTGNGASTQYQYDADGRTTQILNLNADGTTASYYDYSYNANSQVVADNTSDGNWTYSYDAAGELTHAVFQSTNTAIQNQDISYVYDAAGNRVSQTVNGVVTDYTTNALNQYTAAGGTTYTYDANGNMTSETSGSGTTTFAYNENNQLISENGPSGSFQYAYDALGNLVSETQNGVTTEYVNDPLSMSVSGTPLTSIAQIYNSGGTLASTYEYGLGLAATTDGAGNTSYFNTDLTGNVTGLIGSNGSLSTSYFYMPFGQDIQTSGTIDNSFQFSGALGIPTDSSDLTLMRARVYSQGVGRFLSEDPSGLSGGINLYDYTINDPVNALDPTGLSYLPYLHAFYSGTATAAGLGAAMAEDLGEPEAALVLKAISSIAQIGAYDTRPTPVTTISDIAVDRIVSGLGKDLGLPSFPTAIAQHEIEQSWEGYYKNMQSNSSGSALGGAYEGLPPSLFSSLSQPPSTPVRTPLNNGSTACVFPDPHLVTFDGLYYSFQTAGEFVLTKDANSGTFEVQARISAPVGPTVYAGVPNYSVITEIGIQVGQDRVTIDSTRTVPVWVDGQAVTFTGNTIGLAGGLITMTATGYVVTLDTGESVTATIDGFGTQTGPATTSRGISISVSLAPGAAHGSVEGLLGNYNGNPNNDLTLADGTSEPTNMSTATLYGAYADSWRVTQAGSLLDYGPGQTTATFTDTNYPGTPLSISSFPTAAVAAATQLVQAAGITDPGLRQAAIYDYLLTGDPSVISVEANLQQQGATTSTQAQFVAPAPPPEQVGVQASAPSLVESGAGSTTVLFNVYREGDSSQALMVDYSVVSPDSTYLGASDFGGVLPAGLVTLAAGQTLAELAVVIPAGIGTVVSKNLEVVISAGTSVAVIAPYAQETIVNSAPLAGPQPVLGVALANAPAVLPHQNGNSWSFDLGAVKQGSVPSPGTLTLAVLNLAASGSDGLAGALTVSGNGGLPTGASSGFGAVQPGSMSDVADIVENTTSLGVNTEQFTITPYDVNTSGYIAIMVQQTVTVTDTVVPLAQALLATNTIDFGVVRSGSTQLRTIGITNTGPAGAEALDASIGTITGAGIGSGSFTLLPVGQTSAAVAVGLGTSGAGIVSGTVAIDPSSDGASTDGLGATPLLPQDVAVSGTVYRTAQAGVALAHTILHVGDPGTDALVVSNTDPADGYSESLIATLAGASGSFATATTGPTGDIGAGSSDATSLTISLPTAQAGTISGSVALALTSDGGTGSGSIDGLGQVALARETIALSATIDNYATAQIVQLSGAPGLTSAGDAFRLDFGTVGRGAAAESVVLGVENTATGPADLLAGTFIANTTPAIALSGFSPFAGLAAGKVQSGMSVTLETAQAGVFTQTITLDPTGSNAGGYAGALAPEVLTVTGTVDGGPTLATGSLAIGHGQSENVTALLDRLITPGEPGDSETIVAVSGHAVLANGVVTYTAPVAGPDSFTYTVEDQWADIATGTVAVTVDPGPQVTTTVPAEIGHGQTIQVGTVTPGLPGDTLSLTTTGPGRGTLSLTGDTLTYAAPAMGGTDSIGYTVNDQLGDAASGTIALTVDPGPVAAASSLTVGHGQTVVVTGLVDGLVTPGLTGDSETITAVSAVTGQASLSAAGAIVYAAPASGRDTLGYTVTDQLGDSAAGTVAVTIDPGPTAGTVASTVTLDATVNLTAAILGAVTPGLAGDTLTLMADGTIGTLGSVALADGQLTYIAEGSVLKHIPANGTLVDSFTYVVSDQYGDTASGTVDVTVTNPATVIDGPPYGSGTIVAAPGASIINAYGWSNVVFDEGGNDIVNAGSGQATVYVNTGDVVVNLSGNNNLVTGFDLSGAAAAAGADGNVRVSGSQGSTTVDLGNGTDSVSLGGYDNVVTLGNGGDIVNAGQGNGTITLGDGNDQVMIGGYWNTVVAGDGNDQVSGPQGNSSVMLGNGADSVTLGGYDNVIRVGNGSDTIAAGAGNGTVTAGSGNDTIILQGWSNTVTLGGGTDTVNGGSGDSITIDSTHLLLSGGSQEMVFLDAGTAASIDDLSSATTVVAGPGSGSASILDVARDAGFVLDLTGGVGGFTSAAGVASAFQSDGHGGMQLLLGSGPGAAVIDFVSTQASVLSSAHFRIG